MKNHLNVNAGKNKADFKFTEFQLTSLFQEA